MTIDELTMEDFARVQELKLKIEGELSQGGIKSFRRYVFPLYEQNLSGEGIISAYNDLYDKISKREVEACYLSRIAREELSRRGIPQIEALAKGFEDRGYRVVRTAAPNANDGHKLNQEDILELMGSSVKVSLREDLRREYSKHSARPGHYEGGDLN